MLFHERALMIEKWVSGRVIAYGYALRPREPALAARGPVEHAARRYAAVAEKFEAARKKTKA